LPKFHTVNERGHFTDDVPEFAGMHVKEADVPIIKHFKIANRLYKKENYTHNYPFCWRCDSALIYYARDSWYLETTKLREDMIRENEKIQWFPAAVGENRFGNWLKGNIDWAISRDRYWGTPMPIWECEGCDEKVCIGSREELRERGGNFEDDLDLHRPAVDEVTLSCSSCSGQMNRVKSVVDVWFDSGSMPFAQWHYPFENKDRFGDLFPANFICEGIDQSRGWFYSLLAIGVMETGRSPYKAVLSNELVLDEQGRKMSKRLGNAADPWEILEKEGADALRWYLIANSPPWVPTKFARHGVTESARKIFGTLRNVASFFVTYANVDEWTPAVASPDVSERPDLDRWILSRLDAVAAETRQHLLDYQVTRAARTLSTYIQDELSNWYVRRNRRRFWKGERGDDKNAAYATLHEVLVTLAKLMAPITPFISEQLYQTLVTPFDGDAQDSVHLTAYPNPDESRRDTQLEKTMGLTLAVTEGARAARTAAGIKVRQPLGKLWVLDTEATELPLPMQEIVKEEINVKEIGFQAADEVRSVSLKPNFPALGPRFGGKVNNVAKAIKSLDDAAVKAGLKEKSWDVDIPEIGVEKITGAEATVQESPQDGFVLGGDSTQVALESALTPALEEEGFVRELVHGFQSIRKDKGLEITDRVRVFIGADEAWQAAFERHRSFIEAEVLASELRIGEPTEGDPWTLDDVKLHVSLEREGS
ncbi:MAG: isoleucine--tRNA ligase, partial [Candidatus Eisenbacteria bacterium]|nr:isoleucine--tRNA ligase [Candidatus Eisenbacteria bacterium]